jgi:hypothetical protein
MKTSFVWVLLLLVAISLWSLWINRGTKTAHVNYLQITTTKPPAGKILLPEQRRKFALDFEKKFKAKGFNATVTTTGDFHTTILFQGNEVDGPSVQGMKDNVYTIQDLRGMGFKHLIMTNGKLSWDIDLKN